LEISHQKKKKKGDGRLLANVLLPNREKRKSNREIRIEKRNSTPLMARTRKGDDAHSVETGTGEGEGK